MLPIVQLPSPSLHERSKEIDLTTLKTVSVQQLISDMIPAMYHYDGIGLAAPQVGHNTRICIVGKQADKSLSTDLILINPVWTKTSRKTQADYEGCLSVPKKFGKVKRYARIHVEAWDRLGQPLSFEAKNFFARVIQHEVDHLDGILFIDKATDIYTSEEKKPGL